MKNWLRAVKILIIYLSSMTVSVFLGIKIIEYTEPSLENLGSILVGFFAVYFLLVVLAVIKEDLDRQDRKRERK